MKIYIIKAFGGQWEDYWESNIIAVKSEERAKELVEKYQKEADEHHEDMMYFQEHWREVPKHLNDVTWDDGEVLCSQECFACQVESYYPDMDSACYRYEEIEMED